jgi:hypothetical protein
MYEFEAIFPSQVRQAINALLELAQDLPDGEYRRGFITALKAIWQVFGLAGRRGDWRRMDE